MAQALDFLEGLDLNTRRKIYYRLDRAKYGMDPRLLKKLTREIWEFRTKYNGVQYRLFSFWDKNQTSKTLVIITHGIVKKVDKIPIKEIQKAMAIRKQYFEHGYRK